MIQKSKYVVWLFVFLVTGCSLQLVASYDPQTERQMILIEKKVDYLYRTAELTPPEQRQYARFEKEYFDIELEIRSLIRRQLRRENNEETIKQVEMLANLWIQDRQAHQKNDALADFTIKRRTSQYQRMFTALIEGETAKKTD
ncbi:hypothetical protein G5S52_00695 [Grimontia sp. S25]|uniref:Uncharacterized protein n=1 Tax=Grimontia sedimenti TaxID=2711294 RepID=A0A6M1RCS1_9GAMM|nr:hypothetical protein [Grimontia sedimenti]NGN96221.1 hypothetical protein [Grimontia sedimenti]